MRIVIDARQLNYFTNFNDGSLVFGDESTMTDYVTLTNDPGTNLPESFTICSSIFLKFMLTKNNFISIFKEDGTQWFQMDIEHLKDYSTLTERITLVHYNPISGKDEVVKFWDQLGILFTSVDNPELYVSALWALAASVDWATGTIL